MHCYLDEIVDVVGWFLVDSVGDVARDPRPDAAAPHSGRRRGDAVLQVETVLQRIARTLRLRL